MPYILEGERDKFEIKSIVEHFQKTEDKDTRADRLVDWAYNTVLDWNTHSELTRGDMNFMITEVLVWSMELNTAPKYDWANDVIGLLDSAAARLTDHRRRGILRCVQLELYRRLISSYEDGKISSNGDIPAYAHLKEGSS